MSGAPWASQTEDSAAQRYQRGTGFLCADTVLEMPHTPLPWGMWGASKTLLTCSQARLRLGCGCRLHRLWEALMMVAEVHTTLLTVPFRNTPRMQQAGLVVFWGQ